MNIMDIFARAKQNLKWPKYTYVTGQLVENRRIVFHLAGPNAKFPGTLNVTDDGEYGIDRVFYGRILRNGMFEQMNGYRRAPQEIQELIKKLINDPIGEGKLHGQRFAYCCFCSTELTSKSSLAVGYGPICAEKWGLPWGEKDNVEDNLENL